MLECLIWLRLEWFLSNEPLPWHGNFTSQSRVQESGNGAQLAEGVDKEHHFRGVGAENAHHVAGLHAMIVQKISKLIDF